MNCSREVTISLELGLGLRIETSVVKSDSSVNHPSRSKFELGEGTGLNVLEVATCGTSVKGWIDMCHDLGRVRKMTTTNIKTFNFWRD